LPFLTPQFRKLDKAFPTVVFKLSALLGFVALLLGNLPLPFSFFTLLSLLHENKCSRFVSPAQRTAVVRS
jgi:hypothetical protein